MASTSTQEIWVPVVRPSHESIGWSLRRRWRWVVMVALVGLTVGASLASRTDPQYAAKARLRLLGERSTPADSRTGADELAGIRAQYFVLKSPRILRETADRMDLAVYWDTSLEQAVRRLSEMVEPRRLLDANITELKVSSPNPQLSADLANTIVDVYLNQANQPRLHQSQVALERLRQETEAQTAQLREAEAQTVALRQEVGMSVGDGQYSMASLSGLRQTVVQAEASLIEAKIRAESINRAGSNVLLALQTTPLNDRISHDLANRLMLLEARVGELEQRYGPEHPLVQKARVEWGELMQTAGAQVTRIVELARAEQGAAQVRAEESRQRLRDAASTLVAAGGVYGRLLAAQHREETLRNLTRLLTDRSQKLDVELNLIGPAADVIELATAPTMPELGTPLQVAMAATGIGVLLGMVFAVGLDRFDGRIRGAEEVEWALQVPMLGAVGPIRSVLSPARPSPAVESFRMIRNAIDFADHTMHTLCVTAAGHREGASTTVANLAWAWAEHGARVLIIDANLQRPSLPRLLGARNEIGLTDFLMNRHSLQELVQETHTPNISFIAAGRAAGSQSVPAMTPQSLSELLLWARSRAEIILFDTAPLLQASDTSIVSRQADGTILVARQQWTATRDLRRAVHVLDSTGDGLIGVVLTGASSGASWDPIQINDPNEEALETAARRVAVSRQRKRTRKAA